MDNKLIHNELTIKDKNRLSCNGVINILGFDPSYISVETDGGRIVIEGENLKIESLEKDSGRMYIVGKITGVYYSEEKAKKAFTRWFG